MHSWHSINTPHHPYVKAGVMLGELVPIAGVQQDLFPPPTLTSSGESNPTQAKSTRLMHAIDSIIQKMGKESIKLASEEFKRPWNSRTTRVVATPQIGMG
jgi:DNA polymerase V